MTNSTSGRAEIALYHAVKMDEDFEDAAQALLRVVRLAAREHPGKPRHLFLDIDGHRNDQGGFDPDMFELQSGFITAFLSRWLASFSLPLSPGKRFETNQQHEDVPDTLTFEEGGPSEGRADRLLEQARSSGRPIFDSETGGYVRPD